MPPGTQGMACPVPIIEVASNENLLGIRCPHREIGSLHPIHSDNMRTQLLIETEMIPLVEQIEVILGQQRYIIRHRLHRKLQISARNCTITLRRKYTSLRVRGQEEFTHRNRKFDKRDKIC